MTSEKIKQIRSLFRCREDVYAVRWEGKGKSGYMPAYHVDWSDYRRHKAGGGTFRDYPKKQYMALCDDAIVNHLTGRQMIGIYPLLEDNTSYFIAADFDDPNWKNLVGKLHATCSGFGIDSCIERSLSGNGAHLWVFFEDNLPAEQTRKLMFELLRQAGIMSRFEKEPGFDRLFPNQDVHSGSSIGNLIALPLNGNALQKGNTAFLCPNTFEPFESQFGFLKNIQKLKKALFSELYHQFFKTTPATPLQSSNTGSAKFEIDIFISNQIYLKQIQLNDKLISFLRDNLNFINSDYIVKKNLGMSTFNIEKYFNLIREASDGIIIPRGFVSKLIAFCRQEKIAFKIIDNRNRLDPVEFASDIQLLPHQESVIEMVSEKDFGVIVSPPSSGKTVIGLEIIVQKKQPALIIVHRKQLFEQWMERIQNFLKIPKSEIGQIGNQKFKIGKKITVAMIQTLVRSVETPKIVSSFGTIIVDECHHIPAKSYRETIVNFNSAYLYGLTATAKRKNNDEKLIYAFIGNILYQAEQKEQIKQQYASAEINIKETDLFAPFDYRIDKYETISRILIHDTHRNSLIVNDIEQNADRFKTILVLTERKAHVDILNLYLKNRFETITIYGDDSQQSRKNKIEQLKQGHYKIVISTGQYFGEGIDLDHLECLFIVYPFAFEGKLIQYIGRIQRSGRPPVIFDYRDSKIDYFDKMFKQRNRYYKKLV